MNDASLRASSGSQDGWCALHLACEKGHARIVDLLLQAGAKFSLEKEDKCNALHVAAFAGHVECLEILLRHGAEVDKKFRVSMRETYRLE